MDVIECLGGDVSLLRVSHMLQDSLLPVLGFGIGGRNALLLLSDLGGDDL